MSAVLPQIWLRLIADPAFAARLRENFAATLQAEGYASALPISDLPSVYRWHTALRAGAAANRLEPPVGVRHARTPIAMNPSHRVPHLPPRAED